MLRLALPFLLIRRTDSWLGAFPVSSNTPMNHEMVKAHSYHVRKSFTRWFGIGTYHLCGGWLFIAHWDNHARAVSIWHLFAVVAFFQAWRKNGLGEMDEWDKWVHQYAPLRNTIDRKAPFDGRMWETYDVELDYVKQFALHTPNKVWTLMDCDGTMVITSGMWHVNRIGYFITQVPFNGENGEIEVTLHDYAIEEEIASV